MSANGTTQLPRLTAGGRRLVLARLVGYGFAHAGAIVAVALLVNSGFDRLHHRHSLGSTPGVTGFALAFVAVTGVRAWARMAERTDAERLGQGYVHDVRMVLYERIASLAPRALKRRRQGGMMLRWVADLTSLQQWLSLGLARLTVALTTMVLALAGLSALNLRLALAVGVVLIAGAIAALSRGHPIRAAAIQARRHRFRLAANVNEKMVAMAVIQACDQVEREGTRIAQQSQRLQNAMVKRARVFGQLMAMAEATAALATGVALLVGAHEVAAGRATPGTVVGAIMIVGMLAPSIQGLGKVEQYWLNSRVSLAKICEFLDTPSLVREVPGAPDLQPVRGQLVVEDVCLEGSLADMSAQAQPGDVVAVVGPNGAGKSTLLSLVARLIDPDDGAIYLDAQDIARHSLASVRKAVGIAGPDLPLLRGTVKKNVRYRWPDAPEEELARVARLCGLDEVLGALPEGAATRLGESGHGLSAGQRQRIALARALIGQPSILLLDEPEANLDARSMAIIDRVIAAHRGTVLIVTHRLEQVRKADVVWHLDGGRLVEAGPAVELLGTDGPTTRLFNLPAPVTATPLEALHPTPGGGFQNGPQQVNGNARSEPEIEPTLRARRSRPEGANNESTALPGARPRLRFLGRWAARRSRRDGVQVGSASSNDPASAQQPPSLDIDINRAGAEELSRLPGVGRKAAEGIVSYRREHGPFPSVEALTQVERFDVARVRRLAPHATVTTLHRTAIS
jgi:competence ComEA-like helix-hairpin-helix protein